MMIKLIIAKPILVNLVVKILLKHKFNGASQYTGVIVIKIIEIGIKTIANFFQVLNIFLEKKNKRNKIKIKGIRPTTKG